MIIVEAIKLCENLSYQPLWWPTPLIVAFRSQGPANLCVLSQPGLHSVKCLSVWSLQFSIFIPFSPAPIYYLYIHMCLGIRLKFSMQGQMSQHVETLVGKPEFDRSSSPQERKEKRHPNEVPTRPLAMAASAGSCLPGSCCQSLGIQSFS